MKKDKITLEVNFNIKPEQLYADWLNSKTHTKFTGGVAQITDEIDANYSTWDGYISGKNIALEKGKRIIQTWRTSEFSSNEEDSTLELIFEPTKDNVTKLILIHSNIPNGEGDKYKEGWVEHYFKPMKAYYNKIKN